MSETQPKWGPCELCTYVALQNARFAVGLDADHGMVLDFFNSAVRGGVVFG